MEYEEIPENEFDGQGMGGPRPYGPEEAPWPRMNRKQRRANMQRDPRDLSGAIDLSPPQMGRVTAPPALFLRDVNDEGWCPAPIVNGQGILARSQYLGADELINEIIGGCRQMVREEIRIALAAFLKDFIEGPEETAPENVVSIDKGEPVKVRIPRTGPREA